MRKESLGVFGTAFLLVIGIASASVLDYYGLIKGTADVKGPTFYASPEKKLLINEKPATHTAYKITDGEALVFWTEENLGGIDFDYVPKVDLYVNVSVNNPAPPKPIELIFGYSDTSGIMHEVCSSTVDVDSTELNNFHTSCSGSEALTDVNEFYYKIQGMGDPNIEYEVSTKNTRVEVDKA